MQLSRPPFPHPRTFPLLRQEQSRRALSYLARAAAMSTLPSFSAHRSDAFFPRSRSFSLRQMAIDYNHLINQFGTKQIDDELLERFEHLTGRKPHLLLRRGTFFSHRCVLCVPIALDVRFASVRSEADATSPSSQRAQPHPRPVRAEEAVLPLHRPRPVERLDAPRPHDPLRLHPVAPGRVRLPARHPAHRCVSLSRSRRAGAAVKAAQARTRCSGRRLTLCTTVLSLADDEKFLFKSNLKLEQCHGFAYQNAKDIIACGFKLDKTFIFSDLDFVGCVARSSLRVEGTSGGGSSVPAARSGRPRC